MNNGAVESIERRFGEYVACEIKRIGKVIPDHFNLNYTFGNNCTLSRIILIN
jgi:hypothetical protein